jgi:hypothetical protein
MGDPRETPAYDLGENDRVVVFRVASGVDQGESAMTSSLTQSGQQGSIFTKLRNIPSAELLEEIRLVPEPCSESGAGREVTLPRIKPSALM